MLDHILREGDRVRMQMPSDSRSYGLKGVKNGTLGTVTGRCRIHGIIVNRYPRSSFREPGVYSVDGAIMVKWDECDRVENFDTREEAIDYAVVWFASGYDPEENETLCGKVPFGTTKDIMRL